MTPGVWLANERPTVDRVLAWGRRSLPASPSASLDAQLLLGEVLGRRREWLLAHGEAEVSVQSLITFERLIERRAVGVPVAYLLGRVFWLDLELEVTADVLIPRPETECLLERALELVSGRHPLVAADVGTGSGAIAIALARALPDTTVVATDVSAAALDVAARNAARYELQHRITFVRGSLSRPLDTAPDLLVANLPYLSDERMCSLPLDVRHEPSGALRGGTRGTELYQQLIAEIARAGWAPPLALEIDAEQSTEMIELLREHLPPGTIRVFPDLAGLDRVVTYSPD